MAHTLRSKDVQVSFALPCPPWLKVIGQERSWVFPEVTMCRHIHAHAHRQSWGLCLGCWVNVWWVNTWNQGVRRLKSTLPSLQWLAHFSGDIISFSVTRWIQFLIHFCLGSVFPFSVLLLSFRYFLSIPCLQVSGPFPLQSTNKPL